MAKIEVKTGCEGPQHDPYGYDEWTVTLTSGKLVRIHSGLAQWVETEADDTRVVEVLGNVLKFPRVKRGPRIQCGLMSGPTVDEVLPLVGVTLTLKQIRRAYEDCRERELRPHYAHGGMQWQQGYPGEELLMCSCGKVIDYTFNLSAVE